MLHDDRPVLGQAETPQRAEDRVGGRLLQVEPGGVTGRLAGRALEHHQVVNARQAGEPLT